MSHPLSSNRRVFAAFCAVSLAGCGGGAVVGSGPGPIAVSSAGHGATPGPGSTGGSGASPTGSPGSGASSSPTSGSTPSVSSTACPALVKRPAIVASSADRFAWSASYKRSRRTGKARDTGGGPSSLYAGPAPRPGPDILYAAPAVAPQFVNSGIWSAPPILVSGTSSYRNGEYVYQDFLYDDAGAIGGADKNQTTSSPDYISGPVGTYTYPTNPAYLGSADIVDFRMKPTADSTAFRMTFAGMSDPSLVGFTIGLGSAAASLAMPFGANTKQIAQVFVTVHGNTAVATDAATGAVLANSACGSTFSAVTNVASHQIEVRLPYSVYDTRGNSALRVSAASGLWDGAHNQYLIPASTSSTTAAGGGALPTTSAFFNVAYRHAEIYAKEPDVNGQQGFRDYGQASALTTGDVSSFFDLVDMNELAAGTDDDMVGLPQGVLTTGAFDRILASHYTSGAGAGFVANSCDGFLGICQPEYLGNLQPYAIYVPKKAQPSTGYGLTLQMHALTGTYNFFNGMTWQMNLGERGTGSIIITPEGRGPDNWYYNLSGADVFEDWADVAAHYQLDPDFTAIDGYSMGGYGSFKLSTSYPDLFARAHTLVGTVAAQTDYNGGPALPGTFTEIPRVLPSLRNLPILMYYAGQDELVPATGSTQLQQAIDALQYRYEWDLFTPAEHFTIYSLDIFDRDVAFLGNNRVDRNPAHVTYVLNPDWSDPSHLFVNDHVYWLSNLSLRDGSGDSPIGTIDVKSAGFGLADPVASSETPVAGVAATGATTYQGFTRTWAAAAAQLVADSLTITATNMGNVEINPARAKVDCNAMLDVKTDGAVTITLTGCGSKSFARGRTQLRVR